MGTEVAGLAFAMVVGSGMMLKFIMGRLAKLEDDYRTVITNHIAHSTEAMNLNTRAIEKLTEAIRAQGK